MEGRAEIGARPLDGLERFVEAQGWCYADALAELKAGRKASHWMWFVFPQLVGLGRSERARFYGIRDRAEARAYLDHPLLGPRLLDCTAAVAGWAGERTAEAIMGPVDAIKLRSSMTLFEAVSDAPGPFASVLDDFYQGRRDGETLRLLGA